MRQARFAVLVASLLCAGGSAFAQADSDKPAPPPQAVQAPAPTDVKAFDDWSVRCFPIKSPAQCDVFQATVDKATQRRIVSTSIAYAPSFNSYMAKIIVPLGIKLSGGVSLNADKYKSAPLSVTRCEDDGCYVEGVLPAALVEKLLAGKSAGIAVALTSGGSATLPLSLRGFSGAMAQMKALAIEKSR